MHYFNVNNAYIRFAQTPIWACCKTPIRLFLKKKLLRQPTFLKRGKVRYIGYKYASRALVSCHILSQTSHSYIYL